MNLIIIVTMHFFYGFKNNFFKSELLIPTFINRKFKKKDRYLLCKCYIENNNWKFKILDKKKIEDKFYLINSDNFSNDDFFFLITEENFDKLNPKKLLNFEKFPVRANLKLYLENGGFSSYQSDYPHRMVGIKGNVTCAVGTLANKNADKNFILFRNIFQNPIKEKFNSYLLDVKTNTKVHEFTNYTNTTNIMELDKDFVKPEIYFMSDKYIGIPSFISIKNKHLSFEHTHPPHAYILNPKKFYLVDKLKRKVDEIIN